LKPLFNAIVDGKLEPAVEVTKKAIAEGVQPQEIINNYMIKAMGEVGQRFQDGKASFPTADGRTRHERELWNF